MRHQKYPVADDRSRSITSILGNIWTTWLGIARILGDLIARLVLSLFYFTVFVPFAVGVQLFSDPLGLKARASTSHWLQRSSGDQTLDDSRRQF